MTHDPGDELYTPTVFARQPLFDRSEQVWGYELFYRDSPEAERAVMDDANLATLTVAANAFALPGKDALRPDTRVVLTFTERAVLDEVPMALPAQSSVIKLNEPAELRPELLDALDRLRREGYAIMLDGFSAHPSYRDLYRLADFVTIDALGADGFDLKRLISGAEQHRAEVVAKRVEDRSRYEMLTSLGVSLYQGFFFQKPVVVPGRKLTSNEASRLGLFRLLAYEEPDFNELASLIQTDVSISYRLLAYLNSAAFSFPQKVHSIKQAIVILGWNKVRNWLRIIMLTDLLPAGKSSELPYLSAIRGKFLERAAQGGVHPGVDPSGLFLLGLFSLLDAMLDLPMREITGEMPLENGLKEGLCGGESPYASWLDLAKCFENGNWERLDTVMQELRLDPLVAARCYYDSLLWANSFFGFRGEH